MRARSFSSVIEPGSSTCVHFNKLIIEKSANDSDLDHAQRRVHLALEENRQFQRGRLQTPS